MKLSTILLIYLAVVNMRWQYIWRSQEKLWRHTILLYPSSYRAHENLAKYLYNKDPLLALYHFDKSAKCVDKSRGQWSKDMRAQYQTHCDKVIDARYRWFRAGREQVKK